MNWRSPRSSKSNFSSPTCFNIFLVIPFVHLKHPKWCEPWSEKNAAELKNVTPSMRCTLIVDIGLISCSVPVAAVPKNEWKHIPEFFWQQRWSRQTASRQNKQRWVWLECQGSIKSRLLSGTDESFSSVHLILGGCWDQKVLDFLWITKTCWAVVWFKDAP